jgi:hypothetical protein
LRPESPRQRQRDSQLASVAERLNAIVEAAERAAESVIDDAEAEARRYLAEAKADADRAGSERETELARLVDSLLADAVAMQGGAERMVESLRRAQEGLRPQAPEPAEEAAGEAPRLAPVEQLRPREPLAAEPQPGPMASLSAGEQPRAASATAGARLLATQLAVSGSSREEIDRRLRSGFQLEDTSAILDAILGPEE